MDKDNQVMIYFLYSDIPYIIIKSSLSSLIELKNTQI